MKLKTNSWHYRFLMYFWNETPNNLCSYFWGLILTIAFLPIICFIKLLDTITSSYSGLPDNLVFNVIKAKKEKYCPKLEFIEDVPK